MPGLSTGCSSHWTLKKAILLLSTVGSTLALIESTQPLKGKSFIGHGVSANPMSPKAIYDPPSQSLHRDAANTRSEDYGGPLGNNVKVESWSMPPPVTIFSDSSGRLTASTMCRENTTCIVSLNPSTLEVEATYPEPGESSELNMVSMIYMQWLDGHLTVPTGARHIIDVQRIDKDGKTSFIKKRDIDLSKITPNNSRLVGSAYDGEGNLWFTTGGYPGAGVPSPDDAVIGYITSKGTIHSITLPDTGVENNFAISGTDVYLITGPAGAADTANATGYFYGFHPSPDGVEIGMKVPYDAGDGIKLGGVSRGSGSTPSLIGKKYLSYTDNANGQINLHIVPQMSTGRNVTEPVCSIPLWESGLSANENAILNHWDGEFTYSVVTNNCYNNGPVYFQGDSPVGDGTWDPATINGPFNNVSAIPPGLARIDFNEKTGSCTTRWYNKKIATNIIPILSTKTGLLYTPSQDHDLAREGIYVWYMSAIDFNTGKEVWRARMGAGGSFSNNFQCPLLTPDGAVGQHVIGGFVKIKDGGPN
ncbi:hypothetical protein FALBO_11483 [Fusarium albosuccineum]|uniref:Uncharacterized protein n=1 Tax=Fusarium albosuccineum TaxID=1237068 RepID=A0A8H4P415_9HYPO|nr:hypothetical protein FALBO_11483 [Fusarium albosuccineum]